MKTLQAVLSLDLRTAVAPGLLAGAETIHL
jgi:hypothetical protein